MMAKEALREMFAASGLSVAAGFGGLSGVRGGPKLMFLRLVSL